MSYCICFSENYHKRSLFRIVLNYYFEIKKEGGAYVINASIEDNGEGYTITGSGELLAGPVQGSATAEIMTDDSFNISQK